MSTYQIKKAGVRFASLMDRSIRHENDNSKGHVLEEDTIDSMLCMSGLKNMHSIETHGYVSSSEVLVVEKLDILVEFK